MFALTDIMVVVGLLMGRRVQLVRRALIGCFTFLMLRLHTQIDLTLTRLDDVTSFFQLPCLASGYVHLPTTLEYFQNWNITVPWMIATFSSSAFKSLLLVMRLTG